MRRDHKQRKQLKYEYQICGLRMISNTPFELPEAPPQQEQRADIDFTLKAPGPPLNAIFPIQTPLGNIRNGAGEPSIAVYEVTDGFLLDCSNPYRKLAFVIGWHGNAIDCYPQIDTLEEEINDWLFGIVFAFLLQRRGIFTLHASAVSVPEGAIAFIGHNGDGKSTLASFFLHMGHSLITDDILPLVERDNVALAIPVCPAVNLWETTVAQLRSPPAGAPHAKTTKTTRMKRRYSLDALNLSFCKAPMSLRCIYVINRRNRSKNGNVGINQMPAVPGLLSLLAYTRSNSMIGVQAQKRLLNTYARLVSEIRVKRLDYPRTFQGLPAVYDAVREDSGRS